MASESQVADFADLFIPVGTLLRDHPGMVATNMKLSPLTPGMRMPQSPANGSRNDSVMPHAHGPTQPLRRKRRFTIGSLRRHSTQVESSSTCNNDNLPKSVESQPFACIANCSETPSHSNGAANPSTHSVSRSLSKITRLPPTSWRRSFRPQSLIAPRDKGNSAISTTKYDNVGFQEQDNVQAFRATPVTLRADFVNDDEHPRDELFHTSDSNLRLPDPQVAYANTFYYTACFHTSPPSSRPLNVQPVRVGYYENLLAYPPSHLQTYHTHREMSPPTILVIAGSCSHCDHSARRRAEQEALDKYNHDVEILSIELALLQQKIDPGYGKVQDTDKESEFDLSSPKISRGAIREMLRIERQLDELINKRDREIKSIWKGYTARWGPATIGIHDGREAVENAQRPASKLTHDSAVSEQTSTRSSNRSTRDPSSDRSSSITSASTTFTSQRSSSIPRPRRESWTPRSHTNSAASPGERYSEGTDNVVSRSSVDGVRENGKMVVDWIRPRRRTPSQSDRKER